MANEILISLQIEPLKQFDTTHDGLYWTFMLNHLSNNGPVVYVVVPPTSPSFPFDASQHHLKLAPKKSISFFAKFTGAPEWQLALMHTTFAKPWLFKLDSIPSKIGGSFTFDFAEQLLEVPLETFIAGGNCASPMASPCLNFQWNNFTQTITLSLCLAESQPYTLSTIILPTSLQGLQCLDMNAPTNVLWNILDQMSTVVREREFSQQHARFSEKKRVSLPKSSGLSSGPSDLPKSSGLYTGVNTPFSQLSIDQRQTLFVAPLMAVTAAARAATANLSTPTASMGAASTTSIATTSTAAVAIATTAATAATLATAATATEKVNNGTMYFPLPSFPLPLLPPPVVTSAPRGQFPTDVKTPVANAPPSNRQIECMCCQLEQSAKETPSAIMRVALPFDRCYLHAYPRQAKVWFTFSNVYASTRQFRMPANNKPLLLKGLWARLNGSKFDTSFEARMIHTKSLYGSLFVCRHKPNAEEISRLELIPIPNVLVRITLYRNAYVLDLAPLDEKRIQLVLDTQRLAALQQTLSLQQSTRLQPDTQVSPLTWQQQESTRPPHYQDEKPQQQQQQPPQLQVGQEQSNHEHQPPSHTPSITTTETPRTNSTDVIQKRKRRSNPLGFKRSRKAKRPRHELAVDKTQTKPLLHLQRAKIEPSA